MYVRYQAEKTSNLQHTATVGPDQRSSSSSSLPTPGFPRFREISDRLGTLVEDIAAPNIPGVFNRYFGVDEPDFLMMRARRKHPTDPSRRREFDVIAVTPALLLVNETKSRPRRESILEFAESFGDVTEFFPEYADRRLVPVLSALHLDEEIITLLTDRGIYAMTMSEDSMELRNFEAVSAASR